MARVVFIERYFTIHIKHGEYAQAGFLSLFTSAGIGGSFTTILNHPGWFSPSTEQ
jgi:hypothetical protein